MQYSQGHISTPSIPPQMVHQCPLCQAIQPVGSIRLYDNRGRRISGVKRCYQCNGEVSYGPIGTVLWGAVIIAACGLVCLIAPFIIFKKMHGKHGFAFILMVVVGIGVLITGIVLFIRAMRWLNLPQFSYVVWTQQSEVQNPGPSAPLTGNMSPSQGQQQDVISFDNNATAKNIPPPPSYESVTTEKS